MDKKMTATEFWKSKFDEEPQNDAEKLAVAMMASYKEYCQPALPLSSASEQGEKSGEGVTGQYVLFIK